MRKKRKHEKKNFRVFVFLANAIWQVFGKQIIREKRLVFMQMAKRLYKKTEIDFNIIHYDKTYLHKNANFAEKFIFLCLEFEN